MEYSPSSSHQYRNAFSLLRSTPTANPDTANNTILQIFSENPELIGLPIIDGDIPIGLINRHIFMNNMARRYYFEIYGRKSCIAFMDKDPLVVDHATSIQELSLKVIATGRKAITDGFIITKDGNYIGIGVGYDLVRAVADLQIEKNNALMASISYASVLQRSLLRPSLDEMALTLTDYFIHWEPRDIVGGDFYYFSRYPQGYFLAIADCTGHGVPGAFMTLIASAGLKAAVRGDGLYADPAAVLSRINLHIKDQLAQHEPRSINTDRSDDGMDAALCWFNQNERTLTFAGARIPLFLMRAGADEVIQISGDRKGVGYVDTPNDFSWTNHTLALNSDSRIYIASDGLFDQIGGTKRISFGKKRLHELLLSNRDASLEAVGATIIDALRVYQGEYERRDDLTVFGFQP